MISFAAELLMEIEVGNLTGATMAAKAGANQAFYERQLSLLSDQIRTDRNQPSLTRSRKPISNLSNDRSRAGTGRSPGVSRMSVKSQTQSFQIAGSQVHVSPLRTN